jgi:uncharacterized protein DUF3108
MSRRSPAAADVYILAMMLRPRRPGAHRKALALLALVIHGASVGAAEPERIFLRFEVFGGPAAGLHFLTLTTTVDQSHQGYAIAAEAKTRGLADLFLALRSRLDVRGRISGGALLPEAMQAETHRRGLDLYTRTDYGVDGTVTAETRPPLSQPAVPVTAAQMRGTIDQLTVYLALARHLVSSGSCALTFAVFDGRRRYDLGFADAPSEVLPDIGGPARVCRIWRRRIAGFPADNSRNEATDQGKLWLARLLPADLMVPVRMEFASEFGTFTADLAELRGGGQYLRFLE